MNLPNIISLARLLTVPVVVYLILHRYDAAAFLLCVAAGVSDAIDGYLAKRLGQASELGALLDPIADKTLLVGVYLSLGHMEHIATWLVILVVSRDLLIVGGVLLLKFSNGGTLRMKPFMISKVNTLVQIVLASLVLAQLGHKFDAGIATTALTYLVAATTLASAGAYLVAWGRHTSSMEAER